MSKLVATIPSPMPRKCAPGTSRIGRLQMHGTTQVAMLAKVSSHGSVISLVIVLHLVSSGKEFLDSF